MSEPKTVEKVSEITFRSVACPMLEFYQGLKKIGLDPEKLELRYDKKTFGQHPKGPIGKKEWKTYCDYSLKHPELNQERTEKLVLFLKKVMHAEYTHII